MLLGLGGLMLRRLQVTEAGSMFVSQTAEKIVLANLYSAQLKKKKKYIL